MDQAVAGNGAAPIETGLSREIRKLSSCFFDDYLKGGNVPHGDDRVEARFARSFGDQHVGPEITKASVAPYFRRQFDQPRRFGEIAPRCPRKLLRLRVG